jgi:LemA protein
VTTSQIVLLLVGILALVVVVLMVRGWIRVYNKFQYWYNRAQRKFADVDIIMQERIDHLIAEAQIAKKYDIHEYKTLRDVIEARSHWSKDLPLNERARQATEIEENIFKLQAVIERYPEVKADRVHLVLMEKASRLEHRLRTARLDYNRVAQQYNERVRRFPRNVVAHVHHFTVVEYLAFPEGPGYNARQLFNDDQE